MKDPIKLEKDRNELTDSHRIECELEDTASSIRQDNEKKDNVADAIDDFKTPDAKKKREKAAIRKLLAAKAAEAVAAATFSVGLVDL